jgi:hypothetical protein
MSQDEEKHENVVNLAEARRRQRTVQKAANGRFGDGHSPRAGASSGRGGKAGGAPTGWRKVFVFVQLLIVLFAVAYMMQLCRGG